MAPDREERAQILVTGGTGQVGYELVRLLAPLGEIHAPGRAELDLARPESVRTTVRRLRPCVIVNAGAYTAVDRAESEPELCTVVNAEAPRILAEEARELGALLVHYSTDYVFDGEGDRPYRESDPPAPLGVYGASKLEGEQAIAATGCMHLILRTGWVYGVRGQNFVRTMLRLAHERSELRVVNDQVGAPTWSRSIALVTALVVRDLLGRPREAWAPVSGVYHLTAAGRTTWYEFAREILAADPDHAAQRCRSIEPIPTAMYPTPARRPRYSVLDNTRLERCFGLALPHWRAQLALALQDLAR